MILGKFLHEKDFDAIRKDLQKRPIEGIDYTASDESIQNILEKYGVRQKDNGVEVEIWGSGTPMREFLYSEDMADACVHIMEQVDFKDTYDKNQKEIRNTHINIGTGQEISIKELAGTIKDIVGFKGLLYFNSSKPDGTMRKLTNIRKLQTLRWIYKTHLKHGLNKLLNSQL